MTVELYSATKPASPRRALGCAIILLLLAATLAAVMSWNRSGDPLGARIQAQGWSVSFRPPKRFLPGDPVNTSVGAVLPFSGTVRTGEQVVLNIHRFFTTSVDDPAAAGALFIREYAVRGSRGGAWPSLVPTPARLGPLEGIEIHAPQTSTVVRAAVLDNGVGYAVVLAVSSGALNDSTYQLFDLTCQSIEFVDP